MNELWRFILSSNFFYNPFSTIKDISQDKNYFAHDKRLYSEPFPDVEINCDNFNCDEGKEDEKEKDSDNEEGLFILGVIERAAKERKRTKSVVVK